MLKVIAAADIILAYDSGNLFLRYVADPLAAHKTASQPRVRRRHSNLRLLSTMGRSRTFRQNVHQQSAIVNDGRLTLVNRLQANPSKLRSCGARRAVVSTRKFIYRLILH